ncbi:MAG: PAS domain S-box protein [Acidimicrobiales bacterium]|nr:PAS domain S-box protein [Acidimicrobiales bacterium]
MTALDEATLIGLLDAAPDSMVVVDQSGTIVLVNGQTERLFGYSRDELVGERIEILVPEHFRAAHPKHRDGYMDQPAHRPMGGAGMQLAGRRKNGSEFPAEISLSAIRTESGLLVSASIRDATDRVRAGAQFRGLLEAAPDAMVCVREDGRIAFANARAEQLFGYTQRQLIGAEIELLMPEALRATHPTHRGGYFSDPSPRPMGAGRQLAARRADGTEFPADISLSALETEEGLLVSAAIRDVSDRLREQAERERLMEQAERERLEAQLHRSQRMESLGQLAGGVAHDFNNLLAVILNYASFIEEDLQAAAAGAGGERWKQTTGDVSQIKLAAERAGRLTHQLLAFARREVVQPRVLSLNAAINDMEQILRRTIGEQIELSIELADDLPNIIADPGHLEQIILNLAINARDAMPGGGTLTIDTSALELGATEPQADPGRYVCLRVGDTGVGMPDEVKERAFEPFFTTKPKGEGSGLGLATVYGIVSQTGGFTRIVSEVGEGTTIIVLLPISEDEATTHDPADQTKVGGRETILVVEDEDALREVTRRILARHGYAVLPAASGVEAIALTEQHNGPIDLLLSDVIMPKMQGKAVADEVTARRPGTRVLFMSGYAQPVLGDDVTSGSFRLIEKPFDEATLLRTVREVLDGDG